MKRPHRIIAAALTILSLATAAGFSTAAETRRIAQKGRAFDQKDVTVAVGDTLKFGNDDEFIHQIYVDSPAFTFESQEAPPGQSIDVTFPTAGNYQVRCHIHPKMLLNVHVN